MPTTLTIHSFFISYLFTHSWHFKRIFIRVLFVQYMLRRSSSSSTVKPDPKIDHTFRRRLRSLKGTATIDLTKTNLIEEHERLDLPKGIVIEELKVEEIIEENNMVDEHRTMAGYTRPTLNGTGSCIV